MMTILFNMGNVVNIYESVELIYRVSQKMVIELWRAIGHSIFNI